MKRQNYECILRDYHNTERFSITAETEVEAAKKCLKVYLSSCDINADHVLRQNKNFSATVKIGDNYYDVSVWPTVHWHSSVQTDDDDNYFKKKAVSETSHVDEENLCKT